MLIQYNKYNKYLANNFDFVGQFNKKIIKQNGFEKLSLGRTV